MNERAKGNGCLYLVGLLGVGMVLAGLGLDRLGSWVDEHPPPERGFSPPGPTPQPPAAVAEPTPAPSAEPPPAPEPLEPAALSPLVWAAEVVSHPSLLAGTPCAVVVRVERRLDGPHPAEAEVACGAESVFRGTVTSQALVEARRARGYVYRADVEAAGVAEHVGSTLRFTSAERRAAVTAPGRTIELYVEDASAMRDHGPFELASERQAAPGWSAVRRRALVRQLSGPVPLAVQRARDGDGECTLSARPSMSGGELSCRIVLRCGGAVIYGAGESGYNRCVIADGALASAEDTGFSGEDTDPSLSLDLAARSLVVRDASIDGEWSATFRLDVEDGCDGPLTLTGATVTPDAEAVNVARDAQGQWRVERAGEAAIVLTGSVDCASGDAMVRQLDAFLDLERGVGEDSFVGYWRNVGGGAEPLLLRVR